MKKSICLYFQVHQPARLRLYRFFDIGKDSHYYDDFANRTILRRVAQKCYLPMNALLLELIEANKGAFKVTFSISGTVLEQFDRYAPEVIESFRKLAQTGCVEFLSETYYHSLASLQSPIEFKNQVLKHKAAIEHYFGVTPKAFRNTELIYSDAIGEMVYDMGFKTMLTEGARHVLGWKSPNFVYSGAQAPGLKLLLKNSSLSDDIAFRFSDRGWSEWPLTGEKYLSWIKTAAQNDEIVNLFMDYETFGEHQKAASGIFDFMRFLPEVVLADGEGVGSGDLHGHVLGEVGDFGSGGLVGVDHDEDGELAVGVHIGSHHAFVGNAFTEEAADDGLFAGHGGEVVHAVLEDFHGFGSLFSDFSGNGLGESLELVATGHEVGFGHDFHDGGGLAVGGGAGFGIPWLINDKKQRKEDDLRL